ncbi:RBP11-like subunits of RNA polymerase [Mycena sanguinolenta]|uniref:RBP11-like subunits of RNA polymerase n=1 Tax=Mycena sanguinolenta TaxID=230812 RepID=A0A8H6Z6L7_9AGAR|nr:RBP11-like subunits of RNA polymerase [Mycena sanguinolenta]
MAELPPKVTIMKGASPDLSAATYQIHDESHTIGNALRWMLMKNAPHPSENVINVRIQMYDNLSSLSALITALADLDKLCETIEEAYVTDLRQGDFERWMERS